MRLILSALICGLLAAPAAAELSLGNFNALAAGISAKIGQRFVEKKEAKQSRFASDLRWLAYDVQQEEREARDFKWDLQRLKRRAEKIEREKRDGRTEREIDPTFNSDIRRFTWDLQRWGRDIDRHLRDAERIERGLEQDADVRSDARRLVGAARDLEREIGWLENEATWAEWAFRRIGYNMEAWDLDRETRDAERKSRDLKRVADQILAKAKK